MHTTPTHNPRYSAAFQRHRGTGQATRLLLTLGLSLLPFCAWGQAVSPHNSANKTGNKPAAMSDSVQMLLDQAGRQQKNEQYADMLASANRALEMSHAAGEARSEVAALGSKANALAAQGRDGEAAAAWQSAAAIYADAGADSRRMEALGKAGALLLRITPTEARNLLEQTLAWSRKWQYPKDTASVLNSTGLQLRDRKHYAEAQTFFTAALTLFTQVEPDSINVASCLNNLGIVAAGQEHLEQADVYFRRALAIRQKTASDLLPLSDCWNNLGLNACRRGDVKAAEEDFHKALELRQKADPDGLAVAESWSNEGYLLRSRGSLTGADKCFLRALVIRQKIAPGSLLVAESLSSRDKSPKIAETWRTRRITTGNR